MQATFNGFLWQANFFTQGNQPVPQESGPWKVVGICGQQPGPNPARIAAPYVDVTLPLFQTVTSSSPVPVKYLTLAFVIAGNGCQASWAGTMPIPASGTPPLQSQLNSYTANGGKFGISFGGAAGQELALACSDVNSLVTQYQNVINQYHPAFIDFDLESSSNNDTLREQAIATLQRNNPGLSVSYTVQTEPDGINSLATTILQDAIAAGVQIGVVNVMSMDLGGAFDNGGQMGLSAQRSGWSVQDTLMTMLPGKSPAQIAGMVGVTVMIGTNDNEAEIFQLSDINTLVQTGLNDGWGRISFWSVTRDQDCRTVPGIGVLTPQPASGECSGVAQNLFQYSQGFNAFNP
jgi:hypothetical protein